MADRTGNGSRPPVSTQEGLFAPASRKAGPRHRHSRARPAQRGSPRQHAASGEGISSSICLYAINTCADERVARDHWRKLLAWTISGVAMLTRSRVALGMLAAMLAAGNAFAVSREAQEFMSIQSKMAPDQCELQRLSSQAAAAQRAGDRGKRIQLDGQMEAVVKRLQANQPRLQELAKYVQAPSPDYQAVMQHTMDLRAKCKF